MQWTGLNELREKYLSFFESKGHLRLDSFPLVPKNDPSLLLINSGMAPMKKWFLAQEEPPRHRVTTCQKCIRTPDIERVGITARHGTFFEMLGNFSFQDYFKEEVIPWAWEFLTSDEWMAIPKDRLHISVYEEDDEAYDIWTKKVGIAPDHMVRLGKEDNFWEHGSGPCGPCSEIYFDRGPEYGCGKPTCGVGCDCDRYMEIWNLVFSQFDADGKGHYERLARPNIDTGMGLERLACVMQNVGNLFEVDTVQSVLHHVEHIANKTYGENAKDDISIRVITDHIRSCTFMVSDGILPSNEGRGYVLRRLLRRAARHGKLLGVNEPFLYKVVDTVVHENEGQYPDLKEKQSYITKVIRTEEENFARTIDGGIRIYNEMLASHKEKGETVFSGADAFKLYDTFGFPIDLTAEMAAEEGMTVDEDAFQSLMTQQKERAREARKALGDLGWAGVEFGKDMPATEFVGYDRDTVNGAKVLGIVAEGELVDEIVSGMEAILVLDKTPFYAEMGGQVADHGVITGDGMEFVVSDVQKNKGGKFMHYGKLLSGSVAVGDSVTASIDTDRRAAIRRAHSATHLLDAALVKVLGDHVHQAGSLVEPDRLRFDFTHFEGITPQQLDEVEDLVNDAILSGLLITTEELPIAEAKARGAVATFGEKYGQTVRVVTMGDFSMELCGGTHLDNTAKAGPFRIKSESSVASGVRRIEATTGKVTMEDMRRSRGLLNRASQFFKSAPETLVERLEQQAAEMKTLRQALEKFKSEASMGEAKQILASAKTVDGLHIITGTRQGVDAAALRVMGDFLRDKDPAVVGVLASIVGEKVTFLAVCGKEAVARGVKAGDLVRTVSAVCGGKGGGKPDSAMGGGTDLLKVDDALAAVDDFVAEKLK